MATRKYSCNPEDNDHAIGDTTGSATTKYVELTVDWDSMASAGISGQQARMQVELALERIMAYIETAGKYNAAA
jgi:hypothetical protein